MDGQKLGKGQAEAQHDDNFHDDAQGSYSTTENRFDFDVADALGENCIIEPKPWSMSDSDSLSDSVQTYPEEFGRTYHAYHAGSYAFPNDRAEQDRLTLQSQCFKKLLGNRLFFAPLSRTKPPLRILDVATGLGDWAIEMGDMFPASIIIATDLSPIQPQEVPPNVHFYIDDATDPWEFSHTFDYIHTRATVGCWESFETQIAKEAFNALEPGGWFESQEIDGNICCDDDTLDPETALAKYFGDLVIASARINRPAILGAILKEAFEAVGFVDIQQIPLKMPIGGWARDRRLKETGAIWAANLADGLGGFAYQLFSKVFNRSAEETELSLVSVRKDLRDLSIHAYMPGWVVWGRKPYLGEVADATKTK